jgi:CheY-like chemotaxis protein
MAVLALETDRDQAEAIRHAVGLAGTTVTIVESASDLLQALHAHPPAIVLLPPLVPASDESAFMEFLRATPKYGGVQVLITPLLTPPDVEPSANRSWLRLSALRRTADRPSLGADAAAFAEQLRWCLAQNAAMLPEATAQLLRKVEEDRRVHPRFSAEDLAAVRSARIKFGPRVALIDLSAGGALVESNSRLQPDTEAMLEIASDDSRIVVPFRVLRSHVAALGDTPRYRGACAFKSPLNVAELLDSAGVILPSAIAPIQTLQVCNAW